MPLGTGRTRARHNANRKVTWMIRDPALELNMSYFYYLAVKYIALLSSLQPKSQHCGEKNWSLLGFSVEAKQNPSREHCIIL